MKLKRAFSLVELSIVILIIGVLVASVGQGLDLWLETTSEASFSVSEAFDGAAVSSWSDTDPQGVKNSASENASTVQDVLRSGNSFAVGLAESFCSNVKCGRWYTNISGTAAGSSTPTFATMIQKGGPVICSSRYNGSQIEGWTNKTGAVSTTTLRGIIRSSSDSVILVDVNSIDAGDESLEDASQKLLSLLGRLVPKKVIA